MKRFLAASTASIIALTTMFGVTLSNAKETEPITLKLWSFYSGGEGECLENLVKEWNDTHEDVKIEQTVVSQTDYLTTLIPTAYANGEAPDILFVEPATFLKYAEKGMLADLTPYYTDELKEDILPSVLEAVTYNGKLVALPTEMDLLGLFYNIDILEDAGIEPPETWDELYEAAKALTTDDMYGIVLPIEKTSYTLFNIWPFVWMAGADILSEDGTQCVVDSPEMAEFLNFWGRFYQEGLAPGSLQIGAQDIGNLGTGVAAMQVTGTYMINEAESTYGDVNIGVVPLPHPEGKDSITVAGGQKMAVNANSEHVDEAAEFIFWLFGDKDITHLVEWTTEAKFAYPARQSVIESNQGVFEEGMRKTFTEFYNTAIPEPSYSAEITDILSDMLQEVMFGGATGEEAAARAATAIQETLE